MEGGVLVLWNLLYLAIELAGRGLIDAAGVSKAQLAHGLQNTQYTNGINIRCKLR